MKKETRDSFCPWCLHHFTGVEDSRPHSMKDAVERYELNDARTWTRADERNSEEDLKVCTKCMREYIKNKREEIKELNKEDRLVARIRGEIIQILTWGLVVVSVGMVLKGYLRHG